MESMKIDFSRMLIELFTISPALANTPPYQRSGRATPRGDSSRIARNNRRYKASGNVARSEIPNVNMSQDRLFHSADIP